VQSTAVDCKITRIFRENSAVLVLVQLTANLQSSAVDCSQLFSCFSVHDDIHITNRNRTSDNTVDRTTFSAAEPTTDGTPATLNNKVIKKPFTILPKPQRVKSLLRTPSPLAVNGLLRALPRCLPRHGPVLHPQCRQLQKLLPSCFYRIWRCLLRGTPHQMISLEHSTTLSQVKRAWLSGTRVGSLVPKTRERNGWSSIQPGIIFSWPLWKWKYISSNESKL
jgi:hypothetical protein